MDIKPIKTKADYRAALKDIEALMTARANSPEGERLDVLATLVEAYECKRFPMELWLDEAERRLDGYRAGRVQGIPADDVFRRAIFELS